MIKGDNYMNKFIGFEYRDDEMAYIHHIEELSKLVDKFLFVKEHDICFSTMSFQEWIESGTSGVDDILKHGEGKL